MFGQLLRKIFIPHNSTVRFSSAWLQIRMMFQKKLIVIILALTVLTINLYAQKPKVVIFTSNGGSGHSSACATLKEVLPECEIKLIRPIDDFFHKSFDSEKWYGSLIQMGWFGPVNFLVRYPAPVFFDLKINAFKKRFLQFLEQERPDLLISVIPFLNYPAAWAAERCGIPFLIITLDADLTNWLLNMGKCSHHNFMLTVQTKTPRIQYQLKRRHIPESCIREVGSLLRKEFFMPKDVAAIRKEWNIPDGKKVILLIRGGDGSNRLVDYVERLVNINIPVHLLVCIGRNAALVPVLNKIKVQEPVSLSVIPFTNKMSDLMAVSDLLVTQPSPNVCNEAVHMKLPILADMSGSRLFWEHATIDWMKSDGQCQAFKRLSKLNKLATQLLAHKLERDPGVNSNSVHSFNAEIHDIVMRELLVTDSNRPVSMPPLT